MTTALVCARCGQADCSQPAALIPRAEYEQRLGAAAGHHQASGLNQGTTIDDLIDTVDRARKRAEEGQVQE